MEKQRKKWTPKEQITESLLKFREKRKWQLAFRRYVLERNSSKMYAPYFGLDIENMRKWIELQFTGDLNWENFGVAWQFDHIIPMAYFDFTNKEDLSLCWNFINISIEELDTNRQKGSKIDLLAAKPYFRKLYEETGLSIFLKMIDKITSIENLLVSPGVGIRDFIIEKKNQLEELALLSEEEFVRLNKGTSLKDLLLERQILGKFG